MRIIVYIYIRLTCTRSYDRRWNGLYGYVCNSVFMYFDFSFIVTTIYLVLPFIFSEMYEWQH